MTFFYSGFSIAFILDRITKQIIISIIPGNSCIKIFKFFYITNIKNTGICFGFLDNSIFLPILIVASVLALGFIFTYVYRKRWILRPFPLFCLGLISGGILGNLIDRILFRGVIDFIDFRIWPVFNLADTFIVCGVFCLIIFYWRRTDASRMF